MGKTLLSRFGKSVAAGLASAVLATGIGAGKVNAVPISWSNLKDIHYDASIYLDGASARYSANSINFKDQKGNIIQNNPNFSLVYIMYTPSGGTAIIGGLNGSVRSASGWFNEKGIFDYGLQDGQTANTTEGGPGEGYWRMFVDVNKNGSYGTYDSANGLFIAENGEEINDVRVSNFQPFSTRNGTLSAGDISGWYTVPIPEPSSLALLGVGATTLAVAALRRRRRNKSDTVVKSNDIN